MEEEILFIYAYKESVEEVISPNILEIVGLVHEDGGRKVPNGILGAYNNDNYVKMSYVDVPGFPIICIIVYKFVPGVNVPISFAIVNNYVNISCVYVEGFPTAFEIVVNVVPGVHVPIISYN